MAIQITLPKDAKGKEVPLDTKTLYDEYGNQWDIAKFTYDLSGETTDSKWKSSTKMVSEGLFHKCILHSLILIAGSSWKRT